MAHRLGDLSMLFETGFKPGSEAGACAVCSKGINDPGGKSYGAYQMTSTVKSGQVVLAFLKAEGAPWAARFAGADPSKPGRFEAAWKAVATEAPAAFFAAQHGFIERTHYRPVVAIVKRAGLDIETRSNAVRDVAWSMSVQHGKAAQMCVATVADLKPKIPVADPGYDRALINALYDRREALARAIGMPGLITGRYQPERRNALAMLG